MADVVNGLATLIGGKQAIVRNQVDGPQDGTIISVDTGTNTVFVTMKDSAFGVNTRFGPMPYSRCHPSYVPQVGDNCLVVFVGSGVDRGRVLSWWPS